MKNQAIIKIKTATLTVALALSPLALADDLRQTGHIQWEKSGNTHTPLSTNLAENEANLIFIRPQDNDPLQTSANIGIDGRFQVSLQPGHYSQIPYCSGEHNISIAPTGLKTNNLTQPFSHVVNFAPQQNHYIYVDIDDTTGKPSLSEMTPEEAKDILSQSKEQTHQISRVIADCPPVVQAEAEPEPEIKVEIDKPISLQVLFKFDSAVVQSVYNQQIEAVAHFMKKYPETSTVIEGHTDSVGRDSYNMDLSQRRANAVKQELVNKYGIAPNRLNAVGFGETRPVETNDTAEGRQNNRRVQATVHAQK